MTSKIIHLLLVLLNLENVERGKLQKFEYPENKKSFLDRIKSIFDSFGRAIFWGNTKK